MDQSRLINWALSVHCMLGALFVLAVLGIALVLLIAYLRSRRWQAEVRQAEREDYELKHDGDGRLLPPVGRGICESCEKQREKVYFLASGQRLCVDCYEEFSKD